MQIRVAMSGVIMDEPAVEIRQGFLCPFCMDDLGDVSLLRAHVEEFHPESSNTAAIDHIKGFFDKTKQKLRHMEAPSFGLESIGGFLGTSTEKSDIGIGDFVLGMTTDLGRKSGQTGNQPRRNWEAQTIGTQRSHKHHFLHCRDACINDVAVQTNNLIIRLDKLINQCPVDPAKRKEFERDTVPWTADSENPNCRYCNAKFTLVRRKHHCRLCGKVICHSCSRFLPFDIARKLTNPAFAAQLTEENLGGGGGNSDERRRSSAGGSSGSGGRRSSSPGNDSLGSGIRQKTGKLLMATMAMVARQQNRVGGGDEVSLASLLQQDADEHLRICIPCKTLLERRDEQMDQLASPPVIVQMYERLRSLITDAGNIVPSYARMADSLNGGESLYTLDTANQLKAKLVRLQREIDSLSERIEKLGLNDEHAKQLPGPREQLLRRNIRQLALQTLQEMMYNMPTVPSEADYQELQAKHKAKVRRQIDLERQRASVLKVSNSSHSISESATKTDESSPKARRIPASTSFGVSSGSSSTTEGWRPESAIEKGGWDLNPFLEDDEQPIDPLQQQVLVVKGYLKQAAEAGRLEEVEILERNLRDLNEELKRLNIATPRMP